jgi:hypothetical protein
VSAPKVWISERYSAHPPTNEKLWRVGNGELPISDNMVSEVKWGVFAEFNALVAGFNTFYKTTPHLKVSMNPMN